MTIDLSVIRPPNTPGSPLQEQEATEDKDWETTNASRDHANNELDREKRQAEELFADIAQNREQRKNYAGKIFWLVCGWLLVLAAIVGCTGLGVMSLSDTVLVALISGASVNIIGLMVIVANYLFPKNGPSLHEMLKSKK